MANISVHNNNIKEQHKKKSLRYAIEFSLTRETLSQEVDEIEK